MIRPLSRPVMTVVLGLTGLLAAAPAPASAAYNCRASALRGTLLTAPPVEPIVANGGQATCRNSSASLLTTPGGLPVPLVAVGAAAETRLEEAADKRSSNASAVGGAADITVRALPTLPIQLPAGAVPTVPTITIPPIPLLLPTGATADVNPAIKVLLPDNKLPTADLVRVQSAIAYATASCREDKVTLDATSQTAGLSILGQETPLNGVVEQGLTLINSQTVDPSAIDFSKVVYSPALDLTNPAILSVVQAAIQPVLDALPNIEIPATLARVKVTPGQQVRTADAIAQQALRVEASIAGQPVADIVLGEASVRATDITCRAAGGNVTTVNDAALQCTTRKLVLVDVLQRGDRVKILGAADRRLAGRRVGIRFLATGRRVASAVVRKDGSFRTTAPLPPASVRETNRARYRAFLGKERSLNLKLRRRMVVESVRSRGGRVTIKGRVILPLAAPVRRITVTRRVSCRKNVVVKRIRPSRTGRFSVTLAAPPKQQAAVYRLQTKVRKTTANPKLYPTFTLPRAVEVN